MINIIPIYNIREIFYFLISITLGGKGLIFFIVEKPSVDFEESAFNFKFSFVFSFKSEAEMVALRPFGDNLVVFEIFVTYGD